MHVLIIKSNSIYELLLTRIKDGTWGFTWTCTLMISRALPTYVRNDATFCPNRINTGINGKNNICPVCNLWPVFVPKLMVYNPIRIAWDDSKVADAEPSDNWEDSIDISSSPLSLNPFFAFFAISSLSSSKSSRSSLSIFSDSLGSASIRLQLWNDMCRSG